MDLIHYELKPNTKIHTKEQSLADDICKYFKRVSFSKVMGLIKQKGFQKVCESFSEVKSARDVKNPAALFIWKCTR